MATLDFNVGPQDAPVTAANSGLSSLTLNTTGTALYKSAEAVEGTFGVEFKNPAGQPCLGRYTPGTTNAQVSFGVGVRLSVGTRTEREVFFTNRTGGGVTQIGYSVAGAISLSDTANTNFVNILAATGTASDHDGQKYLIIGVLNQSTGKYDIDCRNGTAPYAVVNNVNNTASGTYALGTAAFAACDVGRVSGFARSVTVGIDWVTYDIGTGTKKAIPSTSAPTVNAGADADIAEGDIISLDGTVTGATTVVWTNPVRPKGAPAAAFVDDNAVDTTAGAASPGIYDFVLTGSSLAGSANDTVKRFVIPAVGNRVTVRDVVTTAGWTNDGGAASLVDALNDLSSTTRILSPVSPTSGQTITIYYNPVPLGPFSIWLPSLYIDAPITRTARLYKNDGTTLVDEKVFNVTTTTESLVEFVIDDAGLLLIPAIADRRTLSLVIFDTVT